MVNANTRLSMLVLMIVTFATLVSACASLPPLHNQPLSKAIEATNSTWLGEKVQAIASPHKGESGFFILDSGQQAFLHRAALIEAAQRSIDAQYYIWNSDLSGGYLARRLLLAADRGVRVRLLLDDINVAGRDAVIAALDHHPNIEIRIYNPSAVRDDRGKLLSLAVNFQRMNRRMHNKTFVVDGALGIAGGRNIGDEYFDLHPHMTHRDRDVLVAGPIVPQLSANFDAYWNSDWSYPIALLADAGMSEQEFSARYALERKKAGNTDGLPHQPAQDSAASHMFIEKALNTFIRAPAELVFDPPQDMNANSDQPQKTAMALRTLVEQSQSQILIESAYLILADTQLNRISALRQRGVEIAAITNSLASNDLIPNHAGYARWRPAMLEHGIELYELRPDAAACEIWIDNPGYCKHGKVSLHSKSAVFDGKTVYIGSFNVNLRSIYLNGETVLIIHSPELAQRVAEDIHKAMAPENSWQVTGDSNNGLRWSSSAEKDLSREPATGWWRRFKSGLFSRLPIEKYL